MIELKTKYKMKINKRYKDILEQCIYKGEPTPLTLGTIAVFVLCLLLIVISTFSQISFSHYWLKSTPDEGLNIFIKNVVYFPQIPVMVLVIYILRQSYSYLLFIIYLIIGFFFYPIFALGGGLEYTQNYFFGYFLGFVFAVFVIGNLIKKSQNLKNRLLAALLGVLTIHICGLGYCIVLAIFRIIDFSLIAPIVKILSLNKILYDLIFSSLILLVAPYIKNVLWICMRPNSNKKKKSKNVGKRHQIVSDNIN